MALVNKGNRKVNEQTEAKFFIKEDRLFLGINDKQNFLLCKKDEFWLPSGSLHDELEQFICRLLRDRDPSASDLNEFVKRSLFKFSE